jgi:hypothetical protein
MPHLRDADGNTVVDDLTPAEIDRLRSAGVDVDPDADGDGPGDTSDDADDTPAQNGDTDPAGGDDPNDPADTDTADDADTPPQDDGSGDGGDPADSDPTDDVDTDADPTDGDGGGDGGETADDDADADPADDPTSAGADGSADADADDTPADADPGGDGSRADGDPTDAPDDQRHGPDDGPDLGDLDDLNDPDQWDDYDGDDDTDADDTVPGDGDGDGDTTTTDDDDLGGSGQSDVPDPDDLDDGVDDIKDRSADRDVSARTDDDGIDPNDDRWQDRLDRIRAQSELPKARRERDARAADSRSPSIPTDFYRPWCESGYIDDMVEQFKKIKQAPKPSNAMRGSDLDRKRLTRYRAGDSGARDFYLRQNGDRTKARRAVGVALDLSGSMGNPADPNVDTYDDDYNPQDNEGVSRLHVAKVAVAGLAHAAETIGDTFTASGFTSEHWGGERNKAYAPLMTGPNEQFEWWHMDAVGASSRTPMAYGIRKAAERLLETDQPDKTLFVVADGEPTGPRFKNTEWVDKATCPTPESNVAATIQQVRDAGVDVVGVAIGDVSHQAVHEMFREEPGQSPDDAPYIMADDTRLPEQLAEVYEDTLK